MANIQPGLTGESSVEVTEENSTVHLGDVRVFTTPDLIRLLERTCLRSVVPYLELGEATVGVGVNMRHLAATPVGMQVTARSRLTEVKGHILTFAVEAHDPQEKVAEGTHWRAVVRVDEVAARLRRKAQVTP
ncbi:MAG: thioesterase family protein [Chloroflexota bacterium]